MGLKTPKDLVTLQGLGNKYPGNLAELKQLKDLVTLVGPNN